MTDQSMMKCACCVHTLPSSDVETMQKGFCGLYSEGVLPGPGCSAHFVHWTGDGILKRGSQWHRETYKKPSILGTHIVVHDLRLHPERFCGYEKHDQRGV